MKVNRQALRAPTYITFLMKTTNNSCSKKNKHLMNRTFIRAIFRSIMIKMLTLDYFHRSPNKTANNISTLLNNNNSNIINNNRKESQSSVSNNKMSNQTIRSARSSRQHQFSKRSRSSQIQICPALSMFPIRAYAVLTLRPRRKVLCQQRRYGKSNICWESIKVKIQ